MQRYAGTCERLCAVDVSRLAAWASAISLSEWPQPDRLNAESPYPAMLTDRKWPGFYDATDPIITELMRHFPEGHPVSRRLSVIVPGQRIFSHTDVQDEHWRVRVHVPIVTNPQAIMFILDEAYHMEVGSAYRVNTEVEHRLHNLGAEPRIHFFFDVKEIA